MDMQELRRLPPIPVICYLLLGECEGTDDISRYLNLSDPKRHLITPNVDLDSYLPSDDAAWETGVSKLCIIFNLILWDVFNAILTGAQS